jgi:hypothetical protein
MSLRDVTLDPKIADLVNAAFDRSWQFVKTDPELAHVDMDQKRAQLSRHLTHLAQSGERDLWRLANRAIGGLRREGLQPFSARRRVLSGRADVRPSPGCE